MVNENKLVDGVLVELTDAEQSALEQVRVDWASKSSERKLKEIREIRLGKLIETDWYSNSDVTMPDNIKTWRQSLRDITKNFTTESEYDELLVVDTDKTSKTFGKLTHSIWSKP